MLPLLIVIPGTMSRQAKGRIAPAPILAGNAQQTAEQVTALEGVSAQAHWEIGSQQDVNGTDFYVGAEELGHIHLDGEAHVPVGAHIVDALVKAKLASRFRWSAQFAVVDAHDVDAALWLFRLRHAQIAGAQTAEVLRQIGQRCTVSRHE
jgi:Family of unknown function (DUF5519)